MSSPVVVDASVAVKWLFEEEFSDRALALRGEWKKKDISLCAPDWMMIELHNVVWKKVQRGHLAADDPLLQRSPAFELDLNWIPTRTLLPPSLRLAVQFKISVYDAIYVALAQGLQCPFVTADRLLAEKIAQALPAVHIQTL